jgi:hypothetical protein
LRARLPRQRRNCHGCNGQLQKFPALHRGLLARMPQLRAIIHLMDDGDASEQCRVPRKNSNMRAVVSGLGTAFLSMILTEADSIFPP